METDQKNTILETTKDLLQKVGFEAVVKTVDLADNNFLTVTIESDGDLSMLIGKNGQNLVAFDHVVHLLVSKKLSVSKDNPMVNFVVDINDYRKSRTNYLIESAHNVAKRVTQTQRAEALLPMNAYERRLVHTELASIKEVLTESIGQEPRRRIVIKPQIETL